MGKDLYDNCPEAKRIFDTAEEISGLSIKKLCFEGPIEELTETSNSQVAILVTSIVALEALKVWLKAQGSRLKAENSLQPICCAGLSLGEYSAMVAAGAIEFPDALRLVRRRGELMEQAGLKNPGAMASILGISIEGLKLICKESGAEIANLNCPSQIVISGKKESVQKAMALAEQKGAKKSILLNVSGPFHSSFMKEVAVEFKKELDKTEFSSPAVPIVSNVTAYYERCVEDIKENLVKQLYSPVRWEESIRRIASDGCSRFYEIGPGKVLKGLLRRIDHGLTVYNIENTKDLKSILI